MARLVLAIITLATILVPVAQALADGGAGG